MTDKAETRSKTAILTGGSRGLGRGVVQALAARGLEARELEVQSMVADAADELVAGRLLQERLPDLVVLCAGASPLLRPLHLHSWETFSQNWEVDTKSVFAWLRKALYPFVLNAGGQDYIILLVGDAEREKINQESRQLIKDLCAYRS